MKTFLVFLGLCLLFVSMIVYSTDMQNYAQLQNHMKALAEECAAGGALSLDPEAYAAGEWRIDEEAAADYADLTVRLVKLANTPLNNGTLSASVRLLSPSSIEATVVYTANEGYDIFRLPFLSVTTATRRAVYEWK